MTTVSLLIAAPVLYAVPARKPGGDNFSSNSWSILFSTASFVPTFEEHRR